LARSEFFDLKSLFGFRRTLDELGSIGAPRAALVGGPGSIDHGRVGILPGSFNPPTSAHLDLGLAAQQRFKLDYVVSSLSSVIIDKERVEGLCQEDRLLLLSLLAQRHDWMAVAVTNRGLYYEQVVGFRDLFGKDVHIYLIVGMDKVIQIFDAKYYDDREAALRQLFFEAQLIAANRGAWGGEDLHTLLERSDNQAYEGRVYSLSLPPSLKDLSSTAVRKAAREHLPFADSVPDIVAEFVMETDSYREAYEVRAASIGALYALRDWAEDQVDLERVLARAKDKTVDGESLRHLLCQRPVARDRLEELLMRLDLCG